MRPYFLLFLIIFMTHIATAQESSLEQLQSLQANASAMDAVTFSPDGTRIATGGRDNIIRVWDAQTGEMLMQTEGHSDWVSALTFSPDGMRLISASRDNSLRLFDANSGELLRVIGSHEDDVSAVSITPDGAIITSAGRDGIIKLWNMNTGELIQELNQFDQAVWHIAFDPTGTFLASASEDGTIWLWGLWGENSGWLKQLVGHTAPVSTIAFSVDGNSLLSGGLDGTVRLWDLSDLSNLTFSPQVTMYGHLAPIMGVGFSTNSELAISASLDGSVRLWDISGAVELGQELSVIAGSGAPLTDLVLNPSQTQAASIGTDGILNLWDMSAETITHIIESNQPVTIVENIAPSNPTTRPTANDSTQEQVEVVAIPQAPVVQAPPPPATGRALSIPVAGINIGVTTFPIVGNTWDIDPWERVVGHFQHTSWLNQTGNVVLGGHSEMPDGSGGIFRNLYNVGMGDEIFVQDGVLTRRYVVVNILSVDYRDLSVVYPTTFNRLTLITCDIPSYVAEQNIYYERLVVIADEVPL